jgi:hypothetical protein
VGGAAPDTHTAQEDEMPAPYFQIFNFPNIGKLASVVLDREDFMAIIDEFELAEGYVGNHDETTNKDPSKYEALRKAEHIPAIFRGSKTERFFRRLGIPEDVKVMSAIVRGGGKQLMAQMGVGA